MIVFETIAVAFSMFSALPMPQFVWNEKNMRYAMCAFPLVGIACGGAVWLWRALCTALSFGTVLAAAGYTLLPILITGGIHLDGFCDTVDALASHADRDKKLEILKDPHTGAFALIGLCSYFLAYFALATEFSPSQTGDTALALMFVLTRSASAFAVAAFPCAKNSGLVHTFSDMAAKKNVRFAMLALFVAVAAVMFFCGGAAGIAAVVAVCVMFGMYYAVCMRIFGGITGDLAGWFVQMAEISSLGAIVLAQKFF